MTSIIKRSGQEQAFDSRKIRNAIRKANATVSKIDSLTDEQMDKITEYVTRACEVYDRPVGVEEIQDIVEKQLMAMGAFDVAKNYIIYRKKRERARDTIRIRVGAKDKGDTTDQSLLLVNSMTQNNVSVWDRNKIIDRLVSSLNMDKAAAEDIAKDVESQIIASGLSRVNTSLIRELVNNALLDHGYKGQLQDLTMYKVPRDFLEGLIHTKSIENSNIVSNNPEAVSMSIADLVLKQWALDAVFSSDVRKAHETGAIHLHDAGFPTRVYAVSGNTLLLVKYRGSVKVITLVDLWDLLPEDAVQANETQWIKKVESGELQIQDRNNWVNVEQLVLSAEVKPAVRIHTSDGGEQNVTEEHGVVVRRGADLMLVRADELQPTDKLIRI